MASTLRTAAIVIGAAALIVATAGAAAPVATAGALSAIGVTASAATVATLASATAAALSVAATVATPKGTVGGNATKFKIDKDAGIPIVFGRTYVGGNVVHRQYYDDPGSRMRNQRESWVTVLSLGPVKSVGPLLIDKKPVFFNGAGAAVGDFAGNMWLDTQLGACPEARALRGPTGDFPGWNASSKLSGKAADLWTLDFDSKGKKFPTGVPARGRIVEGRFAYDPRLDGTFPGGIGACRIDDPTTHVYTENPWLQAITFAYGYYQNGHLVAGGELPITGIDLNAFVQAANTADLNGWKCGGLVYTTADQEWDILKMLAQAGGGEVFPVGGLLTCMHAAPRVSIGTITSNDIIGDVIAPSTASIRVRRNTIIPRVRLEEQGWEVVPIEAVTVPAYAIIDRATRPKETEYPLIQSAKQASEIAMYEMLDARELQPINLPCKLPTIGYRPGDCVTLNIPEANLVDRLVVLRERELDMGTFGVTFVARSEDPQKHPFALGTSSTPPRTPDLSVPGLDLDPPVGWTAVATMVPSPSVPLPAIVVSGLVDNGGAEAVQFDYRPVASDEWMSAGATGVDVTRIEITAVVAEATYQVSVRYKVRGILSQRLVLGPITISPQVVVVGWDNVANPNGTKPANNATNGADPNSPFGGSTVGVVIDTVDRAAQDAGDAKSIAEQINTVTIPAINHAVATANERITAARQDADQAAADANARINAADRAIDDAVRDFAAEASRAQGADEALTRRIDSIVAESGGYDDRDLRAMIATEQTVRADDDRALGREITTVSAVAKDGDDAVRADVKVTTDALARSDEAFAQRAEQIEASLGTVDSRIAAKAEQITTAYADADRALTRRIDSIVAEGGYDDRDVRAEIRRVDTTAIDRDAAVGRRVDTVEATFSTGGGNMVPNSDLVTTDGWSTGIHAPGGPLAPAPYIGLNAAGDAYHPPGENVLSILQYGPPNSADGSAYIEWASATFPVTAGEYLQFSALVNCHRAQVMVILVFRNAAGGFLSAIHSPVAGPINDLGAALASYARAGVVSARVPDGAISAYLILRKLDTISGEINSYAWFLRPYVGASREGQTAWNPYSVGRNSPVLLGTVARVKDTTDALARADAAFAERAQSIEASLGTVDARIGAKAEEVTRAYADADRALGSRATTLEAAASATSTSIVFNDNFNFWPDGAVLPSRWTVWIGGGNFRTNRLAPGRGGGQYCVQTLNDVADVESGFVQTIYTAGAGKWVIEVTAGFDTSGARGAGVTLHGVWNIDFCSDADINGVIGDRPGETRSWTKMVDLDGRDQINVHAMHGWSGFGRGMAAKYMVWHRLALRPATDGEIKAGKADAALNAPGGVLARIKTNEDTLADLPNRYAAASRTTTLEAQLRGDAPSGLNDAIGGVNGRIDTSNSQLIARIEDRATAIADAKAGVVAARTSTLEAQLRGEAASGLNDAIGGVNGRIDTSNNQLIARIEDRATAIADAKSGAVAQTVQQLRSEYSGTAATVSQQAGSIARLDGRTSAYLRFVAEAGDNRVQVTFAADSHDGAGVDIVGNVRISGNLLVTGTVNTQQLAEGSVTGSFALAGPDVRINPGGQVTSVGGNIRTSSTSAVRIEWKALSVHLLNAGQGSANCYGNIVRIMNGTETVVLAVVLPRGGFQSNWVIDFPPEGDVRYELRFQDYQGSGGSYYWNVSQILLGVMGFKR